MANCSIQVPDEEIEEDSILFGGSELLVEELLRLKHLNKLTIDLRSFQAFQRYLSSARLQSCTEYLSLHFHDSKFLNVESFVKLKHLRTLQITKCNHLEKLRIDHVTLEPYSFHSLRQVVIEFCSKLRDLSSIVFIRNLNILRIVACDEMEELISSAKLGELMTSLNPFANLQDFSLSELPNLKSICQKALTFPNLMGISVYKCPKLKKLPLNSNSANKRKLVIRGEEHWWEELQWEDEATKTIFLPCFKSC